MKILVSKIILHIPYSHSLKEKRRVIKEIKDRIWSKFRASIAEIEEQDSLQKAVLGIVCVSNEQPMLDGIMNKIVNFIEDIHPGLMHDYRFTIENY